MTPTASADINNNNYTYSHVTPTASADNINYTYSPVTPAASADNNNYTHTHIHMWHHVSADNNNT